MNFQQTSYNPIALIISIHSPFLYQNLVYLSKDKGTRTNITSAFNQGHKSVSPSFEPFLIQHRPESSHPVPKTDGGKPSVFFLSLILFPLQTCLHPTHILTGAVFRGGYHHSLLTLDHDLFPKTHELQYWNVTE